MGWGPMITLALWLAGVTLSGVWWAAGIDRDATKEALEQDALERELSDLRAGFFSAQAVAARVDERLSQLTATLGRIERRLEEDRE